MDYDPDRRRVLLYCPRGEGEDRCPFSRLGSPGECIPVFSVDEEIYRLAPAMVIATVDKFAQLPWNGCAGLLFGPVTEWCPRHGYRHDDLDERTGWSTQEPGSRGARHRRHRSAESRRTHPGTAAPGNPDAVALSQPLATAPWLLRPKGPGPAPTRGTPQTNVSSAKPGPAHHAPERGS